MQVDNLYEKAPVGELVGIILDGGEQADEVMYYLLHQRFFLPLRKRFEIFQSQLLDDFIHLYPTLLRYYNQSIDALNTAAAIRKLREEFHAATGLEAYEPEIPYVATSGIKAFWNKLTLFLLS